MGYNGIDFSRARMAPRSGIIDPSRMGPPQVAVPGGSMRQAIVQQSDAPQSVAEILSASNPAMASPDLMGAQTAAGRQRQIADMLMQGVQNQDNTSLAGGLSQLGQAFIARGAGKKADKAEAEAQSVQSLLVQQAMKGDQASIAQLLAGDPAAAIGRMDQQARNTVTDNFAQQGLDLQGRSLDQSADQFGQTMGLQRDQFGHTVTQDGIQNDLTRQGLDLEAELGRGGLAVSRMNANSRTRYLNADELAAAGYPPGSVVQVDAGGDDQVRFKPESEYTSGQKNKYINDAAQLEAYDATLQEYLSLVDTVGLKKIYSPDDPDVAKLEAMQQSLSFGAKDLFQLGVLSKDDYEAINRIIPDATGFEALLKNKESFMASAQPLEDYIERAYNAVPEQFRNQGNGQPTQAATRPAPSATGGGNLPTVSDAASYEAVPPGGYYVGPDGNTRRKPHEIGSITNPNQSYPDGGN